MPFVHHLHAFIAHYGYFAVSLLVALESAGVPMPGETALVSAAIFAGTGSLNIVLVVLSAAAAAILGDNAGYWVGREFGFPLIYRYGQLCPPRRGAAEGRAISVSAARRQDRLLRPFRRDAARLRGLPGRRQSSAMAALSSLQRARRHRLGEPVRHRRLFARPRLRALRAPGRPRRAGRGRHRRGLRQPLHRPSREPLRAEAEAALPGPLVAPKPDPARAAKAGRRARAARSTPAASPSGAGSRR